MSRRQLRKIAGYDETAELMKAMGVDKSDLDSTDIKPAKSRQKPKKSGFASFAAFDGDEDEVEEDEEPIVEDEEKEDLTTTPSPTKSKKKRKKKKKKHDDFDTIIAEHGFQHSDHNKQVDQSQNFSREKSVLQIESKYLDADAELKRIFGSAAISADRDQQHQASHQRGQQQQQRRQHRLHRGTIINRQVAANLPPARGGLGMSDDEKRESTESLMWWRFTHNKEYQATQANFEQALKSSSHELVMAILQRAPFHCDALVSLSDACRLQDDSAAAKELLERLLYAMESAFHPRCIIGSGKNRFDYRRPENRPLFGALFRYCQLSAKRGCWRTALEQAKLLLSFDPTDPLAIVLLIPLFALRSGKFEELIQMESELAYRDVSSLPNWSLALALAHIHLEQPDLAHEKLKACLRRHPGLLLPLLEKMQAEPCASLASSPHFNTSEPLAKQLLYKLICSREVDLWKDARAQVTLQEAAESLVDVKVKQATGGKKIPPQIVRHAILCDVPIADLKPDETLSHDPLPPSDTIREYTPTVQEQPSLEINSVHQHFLTSMIPGMETQTVNNMQEQVQTLVNSMASLLDQIRTVQDVPDVPDEHQHISGDEID